MSVKCTFNPIGITEQLLKLVKISTETLYEISFKFTKEETTNWVSGVRRRMPALEYFEIDCVKFYYGAILQILRNTPKLEAVRPRRASSKTGFHPVRLIIHTCVGLLKLDLIIKNCTELLLLQLGFGKLNELKIKITDQELFLHSPNWSK